MKNNRNRLGVQGRKGRPLGFRLSAASKRAISEAKKGQKHKKLTKEKISRSLSLYFKLKHPLSEDLVCTYFKYLDADAYKWLKDHISQLDESKDILTKRTIRNRTQIEIAYGVEIEEMFGHNITPEFLLICKEDHEEALRMEVGCVDRED